MGKRLFKKLRGEKIIAILVSIFFLLLYIYFQSLSIYGGDGGDLVAACYTKGVAHPPGYPLYTFFGWLFTKLPFYTVAWRVGFLSSIPAALGLGIFFLLCNKFIKNQIISLITTFSLGFSYLFWLYAIISEVFSLNLFFVLTLFYISYEIQENKEVRFLYLFSFIFGLSLTHHHTILFILPAFVYLIWPVFFKNLYKFGFVFIFKCLLLFLLGLLPYIYIFWAASSNPFINWENPQNLVGFVRLITRAIYGTFSSGNFMTMQSYDRYYQLKNTIDTIFIDFTRLGVILFIIGAIYQSKINLKFFIVNAMFLLLSGPIFIYYAAFPVLLNFYLGTIERFYLLPYIFLFIWIAYGIKFTSTWINTILYKITKNKWKFSSVYIFFLFPVFLLYLNFPKISSLKNDTTAEKLAIDILNTAPDDALVFLADDTSLFDTQYYYLVTGGKEKWRNIKILQFGTLNYDFYQKIVVTHYPEIKISNWQDKSKIFEDIVKDNYGKRPIMSNVSVDLGKEYAWLPIGLLKRLYKISELQTFSTEEYDKINEQLTMSYQDPFSGALGIYMHPLLADVARVYSRAYIEIGDALIKTNKFPQAKNYYLKAIYLQPEFLDIQQKLVKAYMIEKKCDAAEQILLDNMQIYKKDTTTIQMLIDLYKNCKPDPVKEKLYFDILDEYTKKYKSDLTDFN